jgi:hypothetical protein
MAPEATARRLITARVARRVPRYKPHEASLCSRYRPPDSYRAPADQPSCLSPACRNLYRSPAPRNWSSKSLNHLHRRHAAVLHHELHFEVIEVPFETRRPVPAVGAERNSHAAQKHFSEILRGKFEVLAIELDLRIGRLALLQSPFACVMRCAGIHFARNGSFSQSGESA